LRRRARKKFVLEALAKEYESLRAENQKLRAMVQKKSLSSTFEVWAQSNAPDFVHPSSASQHSLDDLASGLNVSLPHACVGVVADAPTAKFSTRPLLGSGSGASKGRSQFVLAGDDFALMAAVGMSKQHFLITDPLSPDNPILFASRGFFDLTGFEPQEVLGHNCRFLQGPATDPAAVAEIRAAVREGRDTHVVLLNYKKDGTSFWNDLFIAPLRDPEGKVIHFVGVQCEVSAATAKQLIDLRQRSTALEQSGASSMASPA
jgi:PAS domain S-box-containing protein